MCLHSVLRSNPVTNHSKGLLRDYEPSDLFQALKPRDRVTPRSVFSLISWGCARPRRGPSSRGLPVLVNTIPGRQIVSASIMYKCSAISRYQPIPAIDIKLVDRVEQHHLLSSSILSSWNNEAMDQIQARPSMGGKYLQRAASPLGGSKVSAQTRAEGRWSFGP